MIFLDFFRFIKSFCNYLYPTRVLFTIYLFHAIRKGTAVIKRQMKCSLDTYWQSLSIRKAEHLGLSIIDEPHLDRRFFFFEREIQRYRSGSHNSPSDGYRKLTLFAVLFQPEILPSAAYLTVNIVFLEHFRVM